VTGRAVAQGQVGRADGFVRIFAGSLGGVLGVVNLFALATGYSLDTDCAWFSEEMERAGWVAAVALAILIFGGAITFLVVAVGARKPGTWVFGIIVTLACTHLSLISGTVLATGLAVWLSGTPHRQTAKFYAAGPVAAGPRTPNCAMRITVQPEIPRFAGRYPGFCSPDAVVDPELNRGDRVVLVGRLNRVGFVVERVERAR